MKAGNWKEGKVDIVSVGSGSVELTIINVFPWTGENMLWLQEKMNTCIAYVESGQLAREYPQTTSHSIHILVAYSEPLNELAREFLATAKTFLENEGYKLTWSKEDENE
ncbi:MAG: hypothetical protein GY947_01685 [Rhodobacteraceae bacterium]|nr:hypothetical protein [Paracoccaceae bacterium]